MCRHGDTKDLRVLIPAHLSHTGADRWDTKAIDSCLADIVEALNAAKLYTLTSCCGHGRGRGEIVLHDGRMLVIEQTRQCKRCSDFYALIGRDDRSEYCRKCWQGHFKST
jgi:hypothetical protein